MTSVIERVRDRLNEILARKCDLTLPLDLQAEWDRLIEQRERDHQ